MTRIAPVIAAVFAATFAVGVTRAADEGAVAGYENYEAFAAHMKRVDALDAVTVRSLGRTSGGREVLVATIGEGEADAKPAILIVGATHPSQLVGSELAVRMIERLAADDAAMRDLRSRATFYVIPRPSPDASERFFVKPYAERDGNDRVTDDDRDGEMDEDGPDDLDGDGWITQMRVAEPGGELREHPDDPRVMFKADPLRKDEAGKWAVYAEAKDDDGDEQYGEDGPGGVSFDRNWTFGYPYFAAGAGPHQVSEPETRAVADFAMERTNIAAVFSFSPEDNLHHPWKPDDQKNKGKAKHALLGEDGPYVEMVAKAYGELRKGEGVPGAAKGEGSFVEWAYFHYGRWSFAARPWWIPSVKEAKQEEAKGEATGAGDEKTATPQAAEEQQAKKSDEKRGADDVNALRWFAANGIDGFVPWKAVEHADFKGRVVEVGGFKPFVRDNPPVGELDGLADTHAAFIAKLAGMLPRVEVREMRVEAMGGGVVRIEAIIANVGELATMPRMGEVNRMPIPLNWTLDAGEKATLLRGEKRGQIDRIDGRGGVTKLDWLVRTDAKRVTLTVTSPSVGEAKAEANP